jgi:hypothetical protein
MATALDPRHDRDALILYLDSAIERLKETQERQRRIMAEHRVAIEARHRKLFALLAELQRAYERLIAAYAAAHRELGSGAQSLMKAARI